MKITGGMRFPLLAVGLILSLLALGTSQSWSRIPEPDKKGKKDDREAPALSLAESLQKATGKGKYRMLLHQFKVANDSNAAGGFRELGLVRMPRYAGQTDLPMGYWVYVDPYWYIFRDLAGIPAQNRAWGPEQVTGAPNTTAPGDFGTAWASLSPDGQDEWLLLEFPEPITASAVRIHETWNPGAVTGVSLFQLDGTEVVVWEGRDPTAQGKDKGVSEIPLKAKFATHRVKLHIKSTEVRGWNEIDAVGLVDEKGKTQWAVAAEASSTAATANEQSLALNLFRTEVRLRQMEQEMNQMKKMMTELANAKKE